MKTKLEIINETVEYYSADPVGRRAVVKCAAGFGWCVYITDDYRKCAVGRYLIAPADLNRGSVAFLYDSGQWSDELLIEEVRGHDVEFWNRLQALHDTEDYWNSNGLTAQGLAYLEFLKEDYGNN